MACECQTDNRFMLIKVADDGLDFPEFHELAQLRNWSTVATGGELMVEVGGPSRYVTGSDVVNFLRTILPAVQIQGLMARWLTATEASPCSGCSSNKKSSTCQPLYLALEDFAPLDASPLVNMMQTGRIQTFFQPIFQNDCKSPWGYECLMRGLADDGSCVMPKQLLEWAAQERLIFMLDRICRETHIRNAAAMLPNDVAILINFLPTAIYEPSFCLKTTIAAAKSVGIDPNRVMFEVVETEKVQDSDHLASILNEYRKAGFRVALDDVGSGFAGLMLLADLNPDLIKIDRELVQGASKSEMHRIIVRALVQIARDSGCQILAEGVETEAELALMKSFGVDLFQGFLLGRPAPFPVSESSREGEKFKTQNQQSEKSGYVNYSSSLQLSSQ